MTTTNTVNTVTGAVKTVAELREELARMQAAIVAAEKRDAEIAEIAQRRDAILAPIAAAFAATVAENTIPDGFLIVALQRADGAVSLDYLSVDHDISRIVLAAFDETARNALLHPVKAKRAAKAKTDGTTGAATSAATDKTRDKFTLPTGFKLTVVDNAGNMVDCKFEGACHILGLGHYCTNRGADGAEIGGGDTPSRVLHTWQAAFPAEAAQRLIVRPI